MCRSPVVTLPGHHGTLGERMRRALVRMKRKEIRKATNATRAGRVLADNGSASPREMLRLMAARCRALRFFQPRGAASTTGYETLSPRRRTMMEPAGIEPATFALQTRCSPN